MNIERNLGAMATEMKAELEATRLAIRDRLKGIENQLKIANILKHWEADLMGRQ